MLDELKEIAEAFKRAFSRATVEEAAADFKPPIIHTEDYLSRLEDEEEEEIIEKLEAANLTAESSVVFVLSKKDTSSVPKSGPDNIVLTQDWDEWEELTDEVLDFLEEYGDTSFTLRLISAKEERELPGHFEVSLSKLRADEDKNKAALNAIHDVLRAATEDKYPIRVEFAESSVHPRYCRKNAIASIRNYDNALNVGEITWEEYS